MAKTSTSFQPGHKNVSPGAPKKEWTIKGLIQQAMERVDEKGISDKEYVYRKLVDLAKAGDVAAQREVNNRLEGQSIAKQEVEVRRSLLLDDDNKIQSIDESSA